MVQRRLRTRLDEVVVLYGLGCNSRDVHGPLLNNLYNHFSIDALFLVLLKFTKRTRPTTYCSHNLSI